jgi:hypothetical protein
MLAIFNLGAQEIIILAVLGFLMLGVLAAAVVLVVVLATRVKDRDEPGGE